MLIQKTYNKSISVSILNKIYDYCQLIKLRLTILVVFSAAMGYLFAEQGIINWNHLGLLMISGFLITGSANGINQIIEKDLDKLMLRTSNRPVASERMFVTEAAIITGVMGIAGVSILALYMNNTSALLGLFALLSYAFLYTPLKQKTSLAVLVGAFPGAIPPMIGYTAVTGYIDSVCLLLFAIQFIWQFPHFWAIAWLLDEDYKRAGFKLLPSKGGRDRKSAFQTFIYSLILIPVSLLPAKLGIIDISSSLIILVCSIVFVVQAFFLLKTCSMKSAKQLMIGSFLYLPIVQLILVLGKI